MDVYWLEQRQSDVPGSDEWLSAREIAHLDTLKIPKRRADWRLGRWTAKCTIAGLLGGPLEFARIEILAGTSGAPTAFLSAEPAGVSISLSHRAGVGACIVANNAGAVGCDLEVIEPRSDAFLDDYFTEDEKNRICGCHGPDKARLATIIWSAKESALKALGEGLRLDTRSVCVIEIGDPEVSGWGVLKVRYETGKLFEGWWREADGMVRTVVTHPVCSAPIPVDENVRMFCAVPV